jgi:hypothetical protein
MGIKKPEGSRDQNLIFLGKYDGFEALHAISAGQTFSRYPMKPVRGYANTTRRAYDTGFTTI